MDPNQNTQVGFNIPPAPQTTNGRNGKLSVIFSIIFCLIVVGFLVAILLTQQKNTDKVNSNVDSKVGALEKRVAALEAEDNFPKQQVDKKLYQAVFLTNQQTYFAKITNITKDTLKLEDIFYLKTGSVDRSGNPTPGTSVSLTKLGSELHGPEDTMIVERKNVLFWENLKADGQVSKAITEYKKQNPQ